MQRSLVSSPVFSKNASKIARKITRKTTWSTLAFALFVLVTQLAVACGGSTDKPPLTPDDPTLTAMDAGDVPSTTATPPAPTSAN